MSLIENIPHNFRKKPKLILMEEIDFILQATNLVPFSSVKQQFKLLKKQKRYFN